MTINRAIALAAYFSAIAVFWSQPAGAQLTRINIGYSAISGDAMPAWVAKDAGIFEKNGLDVQLVFFTGGTTAVMALVSADTPIAQLAGPAVVNSVMAGSDSTLLVGGVTSLNYYLLSRAARFIGQTVDRDVLEKTWENMTSESVLPKKQYPSVEGLKTILAHEPKGKSFKPEDFYDATFVREFDKSGFTDGLYKKR